jgi:serine/threonine protein kinase HipA of HipAB toxin-antitoxin module
MSELQASQHLTAMSVTELRYIGRLRGLKLRKGADKAEIVAAVLGYTHPRPAAIAPAAAHQQESFL